MTYWAAGISFNRNLAEMCDKLVQLQICQENCENEVHVFMGGATDFKVGGTKQDSRAERAKKNFLYPTFPNVGGTSKQTSVGTY